MYVVINKTFSSVEIVGVYGYVAQKPSFEAIISHTN